MTMQADEPGADMPRGREDYSARYVTPVEDFRAILGNRASGTAIVVGTATIFAFQLALNLLGIGVAATYVGPSASFAQAAAYLSGEALLWWAASGIIAAFFGGLAAGRLSGQSLPSSAEWHGLGSWAVSMVVIAVLTAASIGSLGVAPGNYFRGNMNVGPGSSSEKMAGNSFAADGQKTYGPAGAVTSPADANTSMAEDNPVTVDAKTVAQVSFIGAIALLIGAVAAWLGGRLGTVRPAIVDDDLDLRSRSFHSL